jgi:hypothetical protein
MGVAVMSSTSMSVPLEASALRCSTPNRCCSSTAAKPSRAKAVPCCTSACVPTTSSGRGVARRAAASRRSRAPSRPVTSTGAMLQRLEHRGEPALVLLGQQLGRRHHRGLVAVLHGEQAREQRHHRLAASDVALQEPVHAARAGHVHHDLAERARLRPRELVRQRGLERARELALVGHRHAGAVLARERVRAAVEDVDAQQLLVREARPPGRRLGDRRRAVHHAQGLGQLGHARRLEERAREVLGDERQQRVEVRFDERADLLEAQPLGGRVHAQHAPVARALLLGAEVDELARLQLAAVEEAHVAGEQQHVALLDHAVEERLPRPRHLHQPGRVLDDRLEDAEPLARRDHALDTTRPTTVPSIPGSRSAMRDTVLASS